MNIPTSLKSEHQELHADLVRATKSGGRTGEAAKVVAKLMHPHFVKEEEYALPPLGLLAALADGKVDPAMATAVRMTDQLATELPRMLAEHQEIVEALKGLVEAANAENKPEYVHFAERLMAHATTEEQVLYPSALLIGRYLKAMLPAQRP